ncbi:hypothetical protein MMC28_008291 [Mycoblastus sanguinarius]|nr:hypothetical protein [Mycoblastus sanguinarius]
MPRYIALPKSSAAHNKHSSSPPVEPVFDPDSSDSTSSTNPHFAWQSAPIDKLLLICASVLPLLASTSLLVTTVKDKSSTGPLLSFVLNNRATTQIVVSIVSAVLDCLNVYTVTKLLNLATRIHLLRQSLSLDMITFIRAISTKSLTDGLPAAISTTSMVIVLLFTLPNFLWTGALTPILTNATIAETSVLKIPQYSASANATWSANARLGNGDCNTVQTKRASSAIAPSAFSKAVF